MNINLVDNNKTTQKQSITGYWDYVPDEFRRMHENSNVGNKQQDNLRKMWQLYVETHFPHINQVNPDAAWVDKNGDIATLHDNNGGVLPLTKERWSEILHGYTNPFSLDTEAFNHLAKYLHAQGFVHLDELPQETPKEQRGWDFRMYSNPVLIPPFFYSSQENYMPPKLIPNREIYDDFEVSI